MTGESAEQHEDWVSPSLRAAGSNRPAYELKFVVDLECAAALEAWAADRLALDPHVDPTLGNRYRITSIYFDTPAFDVARRSRGYARDKHRIRRYGRDGVVHLERKTKRDGASTKCRSTMPHDDLRKSPNEWAPEWFHAEISERNLQPTALITYERTAFGGTTPVGPVRMTFDRRACGIPAAGYRCEPAEAGTPLHSEQVIVEMKYMDVLPALFKDGIEMHRLVPAGLSKYRRFAAAAGLLPADAIKTDAEEGPNADA